MVQFTEVVAAGPGWTTVRTDDGRTVTLQGARNWRNNNPGNLEFGPTAQGYGAVGTDSRFAVFSDYNAGREAKKGLLFDNPRYSTLSINDAIAKYAPPVENNTPAYVNAITSSLGVPASTPLSDLTEEQRTTMLDTMQRVEGFRAGTAKGILGDPLDPNTLQIDPQYGAIPDNAPIPEMRPGLGQVDSAVGMMSALDPVSVTPVQRGLLDAPATQPAGMSAAAGPLREQPQSPDYSLNNRLSAPMTTMGGLQGALEAQKEQARSLYSGPTESAGMSGLLGPMTTMDGLSGALAEQKAKLSGTPGFGLFGEAQAAQATPAAQPTGPSPATMAEQYGQYGQGQLAMQQAMAPTVAAANLAADVADQQGLLSPAVNTPAMAQQTQPMQPAQPGYIDPAINAQPQVTAPMQAAPAMATTPAPAVAAPAQAAQPTAAAGATPTGAALGKLVERQMMTRSLLGGIGGGLLGGALLGPAGSLVGGLLGREVAKRSYYPPAPTAATNKKSGGKFGYDDLNDYGRDAYRESEQVRDVVDNDRPGLW